MEARFNIIQKMLDDNIIAIVKGDDSELYLKFILNDCIRVENIRSETAKAFLRECYREYTEDVQAKLGPDDIQPILDKVRLYDEPVPIHGRLCQDDNCIEYALHDSKGRIVVMSNDGKLSMKTNSDNIFYKKAHMLPQPKPKRTDETLHDLLRPFVNLNNDDFIVFLCLLVTMIIPNISHYAILVSAEFGSGKTTLCNLISELIDHSVGGVSVMPNKLDGIQVNMASHYIVSFDNVIDKDIKAVSDLICSSVTGANFTKRKLYRDLEEINVRLHNICILNGINIFDLNKDILSRSLGITPLRITEANRLTDTEFWDGFHMVKPKIMYRLFKTVADVLRRKGTVDIVSKERMADAYEYVVLAGLSLGYEQEFIERLIYNNRQAMSALAYRNEDGFVAIVTNYIEKHRKSAVKGSMTDVYEDICRCCNPEDYGVEKFPRNASAFSRKLRELQPELLKEGVSQARTVTKHFTVITLTSDNITSKSIYDLSCTRPFSRRVSKNGGTK